MKMKKLASVFLVSSFVLAGCGGGQPAQETKPAEPTDAKPVATEGSNKVSISGSTSTEKIVKAVAAEFTALNPGVEVTYEGIGSSAGVKNAISGVSNFGTASREIKDEEKSSGIQETVFAHDGIASIVHPDNTAGDISMEQLKAIYAGEITNWQDLGGADQKIVVVSREDGSGTRGAFEELLGLETITADATIAEGNGNVQTTVAGNPQAIGYVSFTYINDTVKALQIQGVDATVANVLSGDYKLARPFIMVYFSDKLDQTSQDFLAFIGSDEGKAIITENGGIVE